MRRPNSSRMDRLSDHCLVILWSRTPLRRQGRQNMSRSETLCAKCKDSIPVEPLLSPFSARAANSTREFVGS